MSTRIRHTDCPQFMSIRIRHTDCPQFMSIRIRHTDCPQFMSIRIRHTDCPHQTRCAGLRFSWQICSGTFLGSAPIKPLWYDSVSFFFFSGTFWSGTFLPSWYVAQIPLSWCRIRIQWTPRRTALHSVYIFLSIWWCRRKQSTCSPQITSSAVSRRMTIR